MRWQDHARCRDLDPDLFFPPLDSEPPEQRQAREGAAKSVCAACPVRSDCLSWAIAHRERLGVWGGLNERERQAATALRRRGRSTVAVG